MTAVALTKPAREIDALEAIQAARYVEGRDVTAHAVLTDILGDLELEQAATRFAAPDTALRTACEARTAEARRALQALGATGVPTLAIGGRRIASDGLYGRFGDVLREILAT